MTSATSKNIAVVQIITQWSIDGVPGTQQSTTWAEANQGLSNALSTDKTIPRYRVIVKYRITWADGFLVEGTYKPILGRKADLAADIKNMWQYYAGFWKPDNQTPEDYDKKVAEDPKRRDEATKALSMYSLHDVPSDAAVTEKILATNPVTIDDLELTQQFIGRMVRGIEETLPVNRPVAMELRKALAAIIRACALLTAQQIEAKRDAERNAPR